MNEFMVPAWEFYGWKTEKINFPETWDVNEQRMKGHDFPPINMKEVANHLQDPIGTYPLHKLAKGKKKCCIIFDDMTRPTRQYMMLPAVLDELHKGGLTNNQIIFIMATGAHHSRLLQDFQKKLGKEIPRKYLVVNHFCFQNLVDLGKTSQGTPIHINKEVMSCDLKVTLSAIMPHFGYGFGGGSKMIVPGVAGIDTISHNHRISEGTGPGRVSDNLRRLDSEEAARMVGIDFIIHGFFNAECHITGLICGDIIDAHRKGIKIASNQYSTKIVKNADIVVGNGYPMANEGYKAYHILRESVKKDGDMVFLLYTPEGCRVHHYNGKFGSDYGGRGWSKTKYITKPWKMSRVICVSPEISKLDECYYGEGSLWVRSWEEALKLLKDVHGDDAQVAIYPTAAMQFSEENANLNLHSIE